MRFLLSMVLIGWCLLSIPAVEAGIGDGIPRVVRAQGMDRWIDVEWPYGGPSIEGFSLGISSDGTTFPSTVTVGPDRRWASIFIGEEQRKSIGPSGRCTVKVTAIGGASSPGITVLPGILQDTETEVRRRFQYWDDRLPPYDEYLPAYETTYTSEQMERQRTAATQMYERLVAAAGQAGGSRHWTIPAGVYRVLPDQLRLSGVKDFTIHAPGVEIIVDSDQSGAAFLFDGCSGLTLTGRPERGDQDGGGLIIDSQQLPMSVARILAADPVQQTIDAEILPGYVTELPMSERMLVYDQQGRMLNEEQMGWSALRPLQGRTLRLTTKSLRKPANQAILVAGHLLALHNNDQHRQRTHGAVASRRCRDMTYETIRVLSGGGAPADHGTAGRTVFRDWRLYPRPGTSRLPITNGLGQFSKNGGEFVFEDCAFGPHLDDGINLMSGLSVVGRSEGELVITGHQQPTVGSTLTFHDSETWRVLGSATVTAVEQISAPEVLEAVNAHATACRIRPNARNAYRTVLDHPLALPPYAVVVHSDYRADAIVVRGCLFRDQLAQIMLIQGAKSALIENNLLLRSAGGGVSAQFSQYWWEGPWPSHVTIRNNVFRDNPVSAAVNGFAGNGAIAVYAGTKLPTDERLLNDFHIEGNTIINPSVYGIVVRNAVDVVIRHNRIINPGSKQVDGTYDGSPIADQYAAICLDAVSRTEVTGNEVIFANERCRRVILATARCDQATLHLERNQETVAAPSRAP